MANQGRVKVGIIGSQFQADIHAASLQIMPDEAEVVAVASPTPGNAAAFAKKFGIPRVFTDYREMLKEKDIEMVTIAAPNSLHAQMTSDCAAAGKHIVCEKPLAMTIAEGEEMIAAAKRHGVLLMYGEELLFTPKYLKVKEMADCRRLRKNLSRQAKRKTFRPAQRMVLGRQSLRWWRLHGPGLSRHRLLLLVPRTARRSNRSIARWAHMFTPTKPKPKTIRYAFWSSRTARSQ